METKNVIYELRTGKGMSQDELAEKLFVTRAGGLALGKRRDGAEHGDACCSRLFDVSINTLSNT